MAADKVSCNDVIKSCDSALAAKNNEIKVCRLGLTQTLDENVALNEQLKSANNKLASPLRNPFFLTTVGVVIGIVVVGFVKK